MAVLNSVGTYTQAPSAAVSPGFVLHTHTQASSMSHHQPSLTTSSPVFVPRSFVGFASSYVGDPVGDQYASAEMCSAHGVDEFNDNNGTMPEAVTDQLVDEYSAGDVYSARGFSVYNEENYANRMMPMANDLPEQFAAVTVAGGRRPVYRSGARCRDASSQTVNVSMVNTGTGSSSALCVDASTNTPHYDDKTGSLQQNVLVNAQRNTNMTVQTSDESKFSASRPGSFEEASGIDHRQQNRLYDVKVPSNQWASCWQQKHSLGPAEDGVKSKPLFRNENKICTTSVPGFAPSNAASHDSPSLRVDGSSNVHEAHSSCDHSFSNCPSSSPTFPLGTGRYTVQEQRSDESTMSFETSREPGHGTEQVNSVKLNDFEQFSFAIETSM